MKILEKKICFYLQGLKFVTNTFIVVTVYFSIQISLFNGKLLKFNLFRKNMYSELENIYATLIENCVKVFYIFMRQKEINKT
jgi:hypothetical protein